MVGQRFIELLEGHPYFEVASVMASERSAGKKYNEAAKWYLAGEIPEKIADMEVDLIDVKSVRENKLDLIFSAIPAEIAREAEASFAKEVPLFSNTKTYRMDDDVPLLIGDVNPEHLDMVQKQKKNRNWNGYIVTNPNCTTIAFVIPLKPIMDGFGIDWVNVTSMQALSGAGYDGVPSMAILDNLIPFIGGEEEKVELEPLKILGALSGGKVKNAEFSICASCNRVPVLDGHIVVVVAGLKKKFEVDDVKNALKKYKSEPQKLKLPSAPDPTIVVRDEENRPQPRLDRMVGNGMATTVGRIAKKREGVLRFTCLSHNTIRGAAGASVLNAELAYKKKLL